MCMKMARNIGITTFFKTYIIIRVPFKNPALKHSEDRHINYVLVETLVTKGTLCIIVDNVSAILQSIVLKPAHFHSETGYPSFI